MKISQNVVPGFGLPWTGFSPDQQPPCLATFFCRCYSNLRGSQSLLLTEEEFWTGLQHSVLRTGPLSALNPQTLHLGEFSPSDLSSREFHQRRINWDCQSDTRMQVSLVCTDHRGGVSRNTEDRLNRQNANSPSTGTRSKFRAVAMVARSLGQLSVQSVPSSSEQSMKTGMKYR